MKRRDFIISSLSAATLISNLTSSCSKSNPQPASAPDVNFTIDLTDPTYAALANIGGSIHKNNVIIIRTSSSGYTALSDVCTHQSCTVSYISSSSTLNCPCHSGKFNLSGAVTSGPPPAPLRVYNTSINGNVLTVS